MAEMTKHVSYLLVVLVVLCTAGAGLAPALTKHGASLLNPGQEGLQRSDEKVIERDLYPDEPIEIDNLSVKDVRIALNQKFSAKSVAEQGGGREEDWLEHLEFSIKNRSDKRITYLVISLRFPHSWSTDKSVGTFHHFVLGVDPRASGEAATYVEPFSLAAGSSHTLKLSEKELRDIKDILLRVRTPLAEVDRVFLRVSVVGYDDGVEWRLGASSRPEKMQRLDKKVLERTRYDNEPYEIGKLSVKNIEIASIERMVSSGFATVPTDSYEFSARSLAKNAGGQEEEWLEDFQLTLKNKSEKQITYIGISFLFPETGVNGPMMMFGQLWLGIHPKASAERVKAGTPLLMLPGNTATFTLSAQQLKSIKEFLALRKFQLSDLNKATLHIETVIFEDGIMWSAGNYFKPVKNTTHGYERIDK